MDHKFLLDKTLKPGSVVLDMGANIGYYALMELNLIGPEGRLIAIEPSPWNVELLNKNLDLNEKNNVGVVLGAISSSEVQIHFIWLLPLTLILFKIMELLSNI